jgi:hypothetical protein
MSLAAICLGVLSGCNEQSPSAAQNKHKFKLAQANGLAVSVNQTVSLKGPNGQFVSSENGTAAMNCNRASASDWEKFTIVDAGGGKVALQNMSKYVSSENGTQAITCNRTTIDGWEKFDLINNSDGTVSFRGNNGNYISSENGTTAMTCTRSTIGAWEKFTTSTSSTPPSSGTWRRANLTNFTSYPDPNSDECINFNGCFWAGQFAFVSGKQPESWVKANNIVAVHSKDADQYKLKTLRLRQGSKQIDVKVYDMCADSDCNGCCSENCRETGFLIDIEKYTMQRFGSGGGIVEWMCLDCQ